VKKRRLVFFGGQGSVIKGEKRRVPRPLLITHRARLSTKNHNQQAKKEKGTQTQEKWQCAGKKRLRKIPQRPGTAREGEKNVTLNCEASTKGSKIGQEILANASLIRLGHTKTKRRRLTIPSLMTDQFKAGLHPPN